MRRGRRRTSPDGDPVAGFRSLDCRPGEEAFVSDVGGDFVDVEVGEDIGEVGTRTGVDNAKVEAQGDA